jgi:hypothetical protein
MAGAVCVVGGISVVRRGERRTDRVREVLLLLLSRSPVLHDVLVWRPVLDRSRPRDCIMECLPFTSVSTSAPSSAAVAASFSTIALVTQPHIPCRHCLRSQSSLTRFLVLEECLSGAGPRDGAGGHKCNKLLRFCSQRVPLTESRRQQGCASSDSLDRHKDLGT